MAQVADLILFFIECNDSTGNIPAPDSPVWVPWDDCNVDGFCPFFNEDNFTMQIEQNPGPNFIRFEFPGTSEGRSVNVENGTYQIIEEGNADAQSNPCPNPYEGNVGIDNFQQTQTPPFYLASFCFTLEGDCSGTIEAGEEKTCTVKNYLDVGSFQVPSGNSNSF